MVKGEIPESLFNGDSKAFAFYVLVNKEIATCKQATDLPYHKQRSSYLSSGVYSPVQKKVIFWGDALEIPECMKILIESKTIDKETVYELAGGHKMRINQSPSAQVKTAVSEVTRKGRAGFNRLPAKGTDKLQPQLGATASRPNIQQRDISKVNNSVTLPTPSGKIEIRTGTNKDLRQQNVVKKAIPRNIG